MGTNFVEFLVEANRALRPGGCMMIAEVRSRISSIATFVALLAALGFEKQQTVTSPILINILLLRKVPMTSSSSSPFGKLATVSDSWGVTTSLLDSPRLVRLVGCLRRIAISLLRSAFSSPASTRSAEL